MAQAARRYARAIFELAQEDGTVDKWSRQLTILRSVLEEPEVRAVFEDPFQSAPRRLEAAGLLDVEGIGREAMNLLKLLVSSHRTKVIGEVADQFEVLADEAAGRIRATATTAVELEPADRVRITKQLTDNLGKDVRLSVLVDPAILGGLVLQVGDRLIDASVAGKLAQLRRAVIAN